MIKFCFAYFNKLGDFYGQPFFVESKEGFTGSLRQALFAAKQEDLESLKEDDLYLIGEFNNETGEFKASKKFITSMSGMCLEVLQKKFGVEEHGRA